MSETFQRPDKSFFQEPKELGNHINKENLIHKYLPKQTDIAPPEALVFSFIYCGIILKSNLANI